MVNKTSNNDNKTTADLGSFFEDNIKNYNQCLENLKTLTDANKNNALLNFNNNNKGKNKYFSANDLSQLIAPTVNHLTEIFKSLTAELQNKPKLYFDTLNEWVTDITKLNFYFISKISGDKINPVIKEEKSDKRFTYEDWSSNIFFDFIKQFYLIAAKFLNNLVDGVEFKDIKQKRLLQFYIKQLTSAMSPSNFVFSNPEILKKTIMENGSNLIRGFENFKKDFEQHPNKLFIKQTKYEDFQVGTNLATTEGEVIFKNNIFELIHYNYSKEDVHTKPMLVIPPFINKFYIMDLNEKKSMMKYLVDNKINTFLISWKNPNSDSRNLSFKDYIEDGVIKALNLVYQITNSKEINLTSYCVGGTLTSIVIPYMKKKDLPFTIGSSTYLASLVDFNDPGELGIFITEEQIASLENEMKKNGYFDGKVMAAAFNFLRPTDLYWNYVVNNYLMGNEPTSFDMLYWNSDSTRLPERLHSDYLRCMYLKNELVNHTFTIDEETIDLKDVDIPILSIATTEDHIAPWKSVFSGLKSFGSNAEFILANSGHIAGIIQGTENKPGKLFYYSGEFNKKQDAESWFNSSSKKDGSWWPYWINWLQQYSGELINVKEIKEKKMKAIYKAPGEYVKEQ